MVSNYQVPWFQMVNYSIKGLLPYCLLAWTWESEAFLNVELLLILNFSSIVKVKSISAGFIYSDLSFILPVFLDSTSNFEHFWFLNLKNPFTQSKVTAKFVISFKLQFPGVYNGMSQCPFPQKSSANYENSWRTLFRQRAICPLEKISYEIFYICIYTILVYTHL